ncbi:hypothetical protein FRC11_007602 [Ceratobasidium sp. 423]|nr:hypothetical protein FRC11_007602 [Ceratobasidium sp. 423]
MLKSLPSTLYPKVHATQVFGPRPAFITRPIVGINPTYIEDVLPRLPTSNDGNPIALSDIAVEQFRNYLLAITCYPQNNRPGDEGYLIFTNSYNQYRDERLQDVYTLYVDIATLSRLFGMIKLEEWAIDRLHSIFTNPHRSLTIFASRSWSADDLFHLRALSCDTELEQPAMIFIQYFISINLRELSDPSCPTDSLNARSCMDLYDIVKNSDLVDEPILLGCMFLNLLSLGHRSRIWSEDMTRKDRAILYAAQVQLVDAATELQNLEWLRLDPPSIELAESRLCENCDINIKTVWKGVLEKSAKT